MNRQLSEWVDGRANERVAAPRQSGLALHAKLGVQRESGGGLESSFVGICCVRELCGNTSERGQF